MSGNLLLPYIAIYLPAIWSFTGVSAGSPIRLESAILDENQATGILNAPLEEAYSYCSYKSTTNLGGPPFGAEQVNRFKISVNFSRQSRGWRNPFSDMAIFYTHDILSLLLSNQSNFYQFDTCKLQPPQTKLQTCLHIVAPLRFTFQIFFQCNPLAF